MDTFNEFKYGPIGLTPKSPARVSDVRADFDEGVNAFAARQYQLAMTRLKPFAEGGDAKAQSYLGNMYESARGVERNYGEALRWFLMAAEQGDAYSQAQVAGYLYEKGLGVSRDEKLAAEWYAKAAHQNETHAQLCLATMYRDGRGFAEDYEQAAHWYAKAANQGLAWAQMSLGLLYVNGRGVPQDHTKAIFLLSQGCRAATSSTAQYNLGWAYESGTGVPRNTPEADQRGIARRPRPASIASPDPH